MKSKSSIRTLFYAVSGVFWLAAAIFATIVLLDLYEIAHGRYVEDHNFFARARRGEVDWPGDSVKRVIPGTGAVPLSSDQAVTIPARESWQPEETPESAFARWMPFYLGLEKADRYRWAIYYGQAIFTLDAQGQSLDFEPGLPQNPPMLLASYAPREGGALVRELLPRVWSEGIPAFKEMTTDHHDRLRAYVSPARIGAKPVDQVLAFIERREERNDPADREFIWERSAFRYKPHQKRPDEDFFTNNRGFRSDEIVLPKPPGTVRILCVGASTTEEGMSNATTYPGILQALLREYFKTDRIEVINCGIAGMHSYKIKLRLPDYAALQPDWVVYYEGINDFCHLLYPKWIKEHDFLQRVVRNSRFVTAHVNGLLLPSQARVDRDVDGLTIANLRYMQAYFSRHGVAMAVCSFARPALETIPSEDSDYYRLYFRKEWGGRWITLDTYCRHIDLLNEKIRALCASANMAYIPVAEHVTGGADTFGDPCHMKNKGIRKKAETVFAALRDRITLPPSN
jgi:lysophospholipase L1-like esterase